MWRIVAFHRRMLPKVDLNSYQRLRLDQIERKTYSLHSFCNFWKVTEKCLFAEVAERFIAAV